MYWIEVALSFFVPSTSGLAVLSMPILAPVGDFAGVARSLVVTAFQSAAGIVNLITPTSAVVMGGLAIARVPYERWLRFVWPVLLGLTDHHHGRAQPWRHLARNTDMSITYGVHSEAGKLRRVLVHKPGAAMARLTPANCAELLFDDVIWVKQARIEHMTFVDAMRNRGVEVVFLRQMLAETMTDMDGAPLAAGGADQRQYGGRGPCR